ncbi:MAG: DNA repair exonuclease [Nitrospirae bacterium]|nr:DNA repair exonuclease [Nitrospirota bacterium]
MFKFIHSADIHLDSPLCGLDRYEGAPVAEIRGATRRAFINLVQLAVEENVSFILICGDLYNGDWKDYNTGLFLSKQLSELRGAGIRVFIVAGNHDAESRITRSLRMPDNVRLLSTTAPESIILDDVGAAIHGQGLPTGAVTKDLASSYPGAAKGFFNIGLLHTSINGREGHENYAPCSPETLLSKGYDYWALGHVHKREVLHINPWIVFPGNTQGRHVKETGPKGCTLVSVRDGMCRSMEHRNLHVLRWSMCEVDVSGACHPEDVVDRVRGSVEAEFSKESEGFLAARVHISGPCRAHGKLSGNPEKWINEVRSAVTDACEGAVWLEKIKIGTSTEADLKQMLKRNDSLGDLLRYIESLESSDTRELMQLITDDIVNLKAKLPLEAGKDSIGNESPEKIRDMLKDVKHVLISRLLGAVSDR